MDYKEFAQKYMEKTGLLTGDDLYKGDLGKAVLKMVEAFSAEGHSGNSARFANEVFYDLNNAYSSTGRYKGKRHSAWDEFWKSPEGMKLQADAGTPNIMNSNEAPTT